MSESKGRIRTFLSNIRTAGRVALGLSSGVQQASSFELQYPVLIPLKLIYAKIAKSTNYMQTYRMLKEVDPELAGAIDRISKMVRASYEGFGVRIGAELSDPESELMKHLEDFEREFKIKDHFYAIADTMLTYGDSVYTVKFEDGVGLVKLRSLPMEYMTAVETQAQIGSITAQIFEAEFYVINESSLDGTNDKKKDWPKAEILHFTLNNISSTVYDLRGRYTYGVWTQSPIEPLRAKLLWKLALTINDIMLRQVLIPRQHHKLDLSAFDPRFFPGDTLEDRYAAAKTAAETYVNDYKKGVASPLKEVDKSVITGLTTEINYIEPKNVTYISPNELIEQIDKSIWAAVGPVETATTGRSARTYASELVVSSYASMGALIIADIISTLFVDLAREHIRKKFPGEFDDDLDKVDIKTRFALGIEKGEQVRQFAVMTATGIVTANEAREMIGLGPLSPEDLAELIQRQGAGRTGPGRTMEDIISDYLRRTQDDAEPVTPQSRRDQQNT